MLVSVREWGEGGIILVMTPEGETRQISQVKNHLAVKFPAATREDVDSAVAQAYARFDGKSIRDFVPLLVERRALGTLAGQRIRMP